MSSFSPQSFLSSAFSAASFFIEQFIPTVTRGGVADYKKYRKNLKAIAAAADRRLYRKIERRIEQLENVELPPQVQTVVKSIERKIDYSELVKSESQQIHVLLAESLKKLDQLLEAAMIAQQNEEDELVLIMALT